MPSTLCKVVQKLPVFIMTTNKVPVYLVLNKRLFKKITRVSRHMVSIYANITTLKYNIISYF